jgi:hypothetical protein
VFGRFLWVFVYEAIEKVGERIEGEIGRCGEKVRGEKLTGMKRDSGVIVVCQWDLMVTNVSEESERNRTRRTNSQTAEDEA